MGFFPLCMDLRGRKILLVGSGPQIADKLEKLRPFGAELIRCEKINSADFGEDVALVVAGDLEREEGERISALCREKRIPVNVVDDPRNSTFFFPALFTSGDLTISVSTGGKVPGGGAYLARQIASQLPEETGEIIDWLHALRMHLYATHSKETARKLLREATAQAFSLGRCLTQDERNAIE